MVIRSPSRPTHSPENWRVLERLSQNSSKDLRRIKFFGGYFKLLPEENLRTGTTEGALATWPAANRAILVPFLLEAAVTTDMDVTVLTGAGTATHNISTGIYRVEDDGNTVTLVGAVSAGLLAAQPHGAAFSGLTLFEGAHYIGIAIDSAVPEIYRFDRTFHGTNAAFFTNAGIRSFASAYPLETNLTSFTLTDGNGGVVYSYIPAIALGFVNRW